MMMFAETTTGTASNGATTKAKNLQPHEVAPEEVKRWLNEGRCVLIDVREPDEHARERIPGSRLLPLSRFDPQQAAAMARPGQSIVLHCRSGRRSADAWRMASSLTDSRSNVYSMAGGIEAWKQGGHPVEVNTRAAKISVMRQVQLVIGLGVLAGSALAWFVDPRFVVVPAFFGAGLAFAGATGSCGLATLLGKMPWNRAGGGGATCSAGSCG